MSFDNAPPHVLITAAQQAINATPPGAWRDDLQESLTMFQTGKNRQRIFYLLMLKRYPVDIETFLFDPKYMDGKGHIWPELVPYIKEVNNPDGDRLGMKYHEVVLTGGIGTAKTTQALYGLAYQLYLLSCYREPHLVLGQDPSAEVLFIFQSINSKVAMSDYKRFRNMIQRSPYFRDNFDFRRDIETTMIFPHRIEVQPVTGEVNATIGQNVIGGLIDEINFMVKTKKSKKVQDGEFDQAAELYSSIDSRRRSRFMDMGYLPGLLYLGSSKNYPGQFTDLKEKQALTDPGIYYWDKRVWDLRPGKFCGKKFWLYVGDISSQPYIVTEKNPAPRDAMAKGLLDQIPIEFQKKFEQDIYRSLREIAGRSALSTHPFIPNATAIARAFRPSVAPVVMPAIIDFDTIMPMGYPINIMHRDQPRAVHVDLAINGDLAGVSCGYVEKFVTIDDEGEKYQMPLIRYDFTVGVKAPNTSGGEIKFSAIRKMLVDLRRIGVPIKWVTFDTYQSKDSQQILRNLGFLTGEISMDVTPIPYDCFKTAINQGRIVAPANEGAQLECVRLERGPDGKVDHPADGSKDMSDSMAGVAYLLTMRKEIWIRHGVQPRVVSRDVSRKI